MDVRKKGSKGGGRTIPRVLHCVKFGGGGRGPLVCSEMVELA